MDYYIWLFNDHLHERSYQGYCTRSRLIAEVKLLRARPVVRWVTTCEARVLFVLQYFILIFNYRILWYAQTVFHIEFTTNLYLYRHNFPFPHKPLLCLHALYHLTSTEQNSTNKSSFWLELEDLESPWAPLQLLYWRLLPILNQLEVIAQFTFDTISAS